MKQIFKEEKKQQKTSKPTILTLCAL